ncbi:MAG: Gfo/Idh/MocA family protein [Caldicoprobacterales bacterium]|jgi:predicted dehydrogenase|nr:Gfo/Idh/MocA family oxidoreductase [Clostridiales bacterium]
MGDKKIKIGIIGAGNIAQNSHIPAYLKQDDAEIIAICDINLDRAREVAAKHNIKYAVGSIEELVAIDEIDAVSICTWNNAHAKAAIAAANAGKHVLCEKPMAMTVAEAEEMKEAAEKNNIIFMMGFTNRFRSDSKVIKEMADSGKLGEIYYARTGWFRRRGTPLGWFTDLSKSGGGPVIDIGVHVIDLTWYFMGKPRPVSVTATTYDKIGDYKTKGVSRWEALDTDNPVFDTEDSAGGFIKFENGAAMSFDVSWAINGQDTGIFSNIFGTKAGASLNPFMIYGEEEGYLVDSSPKVESQNSFENEIRHFLDCIKTGQEPISSAEDGVLIQKILNGIYDSARLGKEVKLD